MRILKWVGIGLAALVGIVVLGVLWLWVFFDPNDYKADIERVVEAQTGRKLVLQGDLSLSVFPWLAVELGAAQLNERPGFTETEAMPFVAFKTARLSVKLLPLFRGQVEIGDVLLDAPSIRLITDAQGRHNWDDLAGTGAKAADEPATQSGNVSASIAGIEIRDGEIVMDDRQAKSLTALHGFSLQAQGIGSGKPFDLVSAFDMEQAGAISHVELAGNVNADWDNKRYALNKFETKVDWSRGAGQKDRVPIVVQADALTLDLAQQTLQLNGLQLALGKMRLSGSMAGSEVLDAPKFTGHLALAPVSVREVMQDFGVTPPATRDPQVLRQMSFEADVDATSKSLALKKIVLKLDDTTARGELSIADFANKALRFDLGVDSIDADRYLPPQAAGAEAKPAAAPSAPTPIPVEMLRTLNARGDLRVGNAKFSGLKLEALHVGVAARDGDMRISPAAAKLYGGNYAGDITLNVAGAEPRLAMGSRLSGVDFAPLLKDMIQQTSITGRGNFNGDFTSTGKDTQVMLQRLAGKLDFKVSDGAYEGMDLWYEIRRARSVWKQQPIPERTGAKRTEFTAIQGTGIVQQGVMTNRDLLIAMQYLKVEGQGTVDLSKGELDYALQTKVLRIPPEGTEGSEMREMVDVEIPVKVTGPLSDPKVRPDVEAFAKAKLNEVVEKEKDKLQEKLQDKLKDLLKR
jgi:AsmA protein